MKADPSPGQRRSPPPLGPPKWPRFDGENRPPSLMTGTTGKCRNVPGTFQNRQSCHPWVEISYKNTERGWLECTSSTPHDSSFQKIITWKSWPRKKKHNKTIKTPTSRPKCKKCKTIPKHTKAVGWQRLGHRPLVRWGRCRRVDPYCCGAIKCPADRRCLWPMSRRHSWKFRGWMKQPFPAMHVRVNKYASLCFLPARAKLKSMIFGIHNRKCNNFASALSQRFWKSQNMFESAVFFIAIPNFICFPQQHCISSATLPNMLETGMYVSTDYDTNLLKSRYCGNNYKTY